jgi:CoA:oxalate CoA-transferase
MQLTGTEESGPLRTGFPFADVFTPAMATIGILSALRARDVTGLGQRVDVSMLDSLLLGMAPREGFYFATGETPARLGNAHYQVAPCGSYLTADDRHIQIIAHQPKFWTSLVAALGDPSLAGDPRFADNATRFEHRIALDERISALFRERTLADWIGRLEAAGALFAPVRTLGEVFEDPDVGGHMVVEMDHATAGRVKVVANPIRLSESAVRYERPPPALGQHTDEILDADGAVRATAWRPRPARA